METIKPSIKAGDRGPAIADLQDALCSLLDRGLIPGAVNLAGGLKAERNSALFGSFTTRVVEAFQDTWGAGHLEGVVDETTAAKLNDALKSLGMLAGTDNYIITGSVVPPSAKGADYDQKSANQAGIRVVAYRDDIGSESSVTETLTDSRGSYRLVVSGSAWSAHALGRSNLSTVILRAVDAKGGVLGISKRLDRLEAANQLNIELGQVDWIVRGVVKSGQQARAGIAVRAFDRDLRTRELLGSATTTSNGSFRIDYELSQFITGDNPDNPSPWLIVEASMGADQPVLATAQKAHSSRDETFELLIAAEPIDEWTTIQIAIKPLLERQGKDGANLDPSEADVFGSDLAFLATESGLDSKRLQMWLLACQADRGWKSSITPGKDMPADGLWMFLFADGRVRGGVNANAALAQPPAGWQATLTKAIAGRTIPNLPQPAQQAVVDVLSQLLRLQQVDPSHPNATPLAHILAIARIRADISAEAAQKALSVFLDSGFGKLDSYRNLGANNNAKVKVQDDAVVSAINLYQLAGGQTALAYALATATDAKSEPVAQLATWSSTQWSDFTKKQLGQGQEDTATLRAYQLQVSTQAQLPEASLDARIATGEVVIKGKEKAKAAELMKDLSGSLVRFKDLGLTWEIGADLVNAGVDSPAAAVAFGRDVLRASVRSEVPTTIIDGFVSHLEPAVTAANAFIAELASISVMPSALVSLDRTAFSEASQGFPTLSGIFGDLGRCACPSCQSVLGMAAYFVDLLNQLKKVPIETGNGMTALDSFQLRRPDVFDLQLSCANAETVLPYIDLVLEVLENAAARNGPNIGPTIAATSTDLTPTVSDTVVAALQQSVSSIIGANLSVSPAPSQTLRRWYVTDSIRRWTLEADAGDTQLTIVAISYLRSSPDAELFSQPENRNLFAYSKLAAATYPWNLPFEIDLAELRLLLEKLNTSRLSLMVLQPGTPEVQLAAESLNLSFPSGALGGGLRRPVPLSEWGLVSSARSDLALWQVWGVEPDTGSGKVSVRDPYSDQIVSDTPMNVLSHVSILLDRSGLTLDQLNVLLATQFIGAGLMMTNTGQGEISQMMIAGLTQPHLDRIHRFLRLQRKLGWNTLSLDAVIAASQAGTVPPFVLDTTSLPVVAQWRRLQQRLSISVESLLTLSFSLLDIRVAPNSGSAPIRTLYETLFLSPRLSKSQRQIFKLDDTGKQLADAGKKISDLSASLAGVLHVPAREILGLVPAAGATPNKYQVADELSITNINWLYRRAVLAKALHLNLARLNLLIACTGKDPWAAGATLKTLEELCDAAKLVQESQTSLEDLAWLLLPADQVTAADSSIRSSLRTDAAIGSLLSSIRTALNGVTIAPARGGQPVDLLRASLAEWVSDSTITWLSDKLKGVLSTPLSADDLARAKTELGIPVPAVARSTSQPPVFMSDADVATLFDSTLIDTIQARCQRCFDRTLRIHQEATLRDAVATELGLPKLIVDQLLGWRLSATVAGSAWFPVDDFFRLFRDPIQGTAAQKAVLRLLDKVALAFNALSLGDQVLLLLDKLVVNPGAVVRGVDLSNLIPPGTDNTWVPRWRIWQSILPMSWLAQSKQFGSQALLETLDSLVLGGATAPSDNVFASMATRLGILPDEVLGFSKLTNPTATTCIDLADPIDLRRTFDLISLSRHWKATSAQVSAVSNVQDNSVAADTARSLLRARVGEDAWPDMQTAISNPMLSLQRDALVGFLIYRDGWQDSDAIYGYYLIDPQMAPCMKTSRLVQAVAAVQLYINRLLFGLESRVLATDELRRHWTWMRNYRVWEANRKVFLFPENWLYPELRDDKSSSFKQLEGALGKGELDAESARQAFCDFLDDVAATATIEVIGLFEDQANASRTVYVLGRSSDPPYRYFWRSCTDFSGPLMAWSSWARIDLDIQGDYVMPFVLNGDLHVAWPVIKRKQDPSATSNLWSVGFSWSRYNGRNWNKFETSRDTWEVPVAPFRDERNGFAFRCQASIDSAAIDCYAGKTVNGLSQINKPDNPVALPDSVPIDLATDTKFRMLVRTGQASGLLKQWIGFYYYLDDSSLTLNQILDFTSDDSSASAQVVLHGQCWVKVSDPDAGLGYVQVDASILSSSVTSLFLRTLHGDLIHTNVVYWITNIPTTAPHILGLPELKLTAHLSLRARSHELISEDVLTVRSIPGGQFLEFTWNFTFEDKNNPLTLGDLGITLPREFVPFKRWSMSKDGTVGWPVPAANAQLLPLPECELWMNGYREQSITSTAALVMGVGRGGLSAQPFQTSGLGARFWAIGAGSNVDGSSGWPRVWYSRDGSTACFFDVQFGGAATPPNDPGNNMEMVPISMRLMNHGNRLQLEASVTTYAADYREAHFYRSATYSNDGLFTDILQSGTFASNLLPVPTAENDQVFLGLQSSGTLAFDSRLPNACYNWEVFLHAPLAIADHLSRQQRFEEAEQWLRCVFDPTIQDSSGTNNKPYLKFKPFKELKTGDTLLKEMEALARAVGSTNPPADVQSLIDRINEWEDQPFRPFLIARRREIAFLWRVLFAYLDNLIAWGDSRFRQNTRESINEATMLYILAARILGQRPSVVECSGDRQPFTYAELTNHWDAFGNAWIVSITANSNNLSSLGGSLGLRDGNSQRPKPQGGFFPVSLSTYLYFCLPVNDKLQTYWNTVDSRLFNIRHCRNIDGVTQDLPLTSPPIDPELLIRATAAGLDLSQVIQGLYAPPPAYRFQILLARANELVSEVKALGGSLLQALEKYDAEHLAILRSSHEIALLTLVRNVKQLALSEAKANVDSLRASRKQTEQNYAHFQQLLGHQSVQIPAEGQSAGDESLVGRPGATADSGISNLGLVQQEAQQLQDISNATDLSDASSVARVVAGVSHGLAATFHYIWDPSGTTGRAAEGMFALAEVSKDVADVIGTFAQKYQGNAAQQAMLGGHLRRRDDWAFQSNQTLKQLQQMDKQILASEIRIQLAQSELDNHDQQVAQVQEVDDYMREKFSNEDLYQWMSGQLSTLYSSSYQLAHVLARSAERAFQFEVGSDAFFIGSSYWDGLRGGLLSGEKLHADLKRLELAYMDQNKREFEITKHISLLQLNPQALLDLKFGKDGGFACDFTLPESMFDMDFPGHYFRRIKSIAITIPCVIGPYTGVNATLTLVSSKLRKTTVVTGDSYDADENYDVTYSPIQAVATSTAQNDSGMFELNFRDERYLPFEGAGAVKSVWHLELNAAIPQFDYRTISDVVIHIRYTARNGDDDLKTAAAGWIADRIKDASSNLQYRMLSLRHDFPTEWAKFKSSAAVATDRYALDFVLLREHFPYWAGSNVKVSTVSAFALGAPQPTPNPTPIEIDSGDGTSVDEFDDGITVTGLPADLSLYAGNPNPLKHLGEAIQGPSSSAITLRLSTQDLDELWLVMEWSTS